MLAASCAASIPRPAPPAGPARTQAESTFIGPSATSTSICNKHIQDEASIKERRGAVPAALQACLNTLRAGLIAARIDLATELYPGVIAAPLIIGSIAGTGGRFSVDPILSGFGLLEGAGPDFGGRSQLQSARAQRIRM
jgi:hypothetical protein